MTAFQTNDAGYVLAGFTRTFGEGDWDVYVVKTNSEGDALWMRTYGTTAAEIGYDIVHTDDNCYFITGTSYGSGHTEGDLLIVKLDICDDCCGFWTAGFTGNTDCSPDGKRNLADITRLIDRVYISKVELCCEEDGNTDTDPLGNLNLSDITLLIDHVYITRDELPACRY